MSDGKDSLKKKEEPKKEEPWWLPAIGGLVLLVGSFWVYRDLTQFEAEGGTRKIQWFYAMLYNTLGKWGVAAFMALGGAGALYVGISQLMESKGSGKEPPTGKGTKRAKSPE